MRGVRALSGAAEGGWGSREGRRLELLRCTCSLVEVIWDNLLDYLR